MRKSLGELSELWSLTRFGRPGLSAYAEHLMFSDTRKGVFILAVVTLLMLSAAALMYILLRFDSIYVNTCSVLAVFSLHIAISSRTVQDIKVLYLLGITLLVVSGMAFLLLAHQAGAFNSSLFGCVILLFLVMPLVPWGLREALLIVLLVYLMFTFSAMSVDGRFEKETLWVLQFIMLGAGATTLIVIGRSIAVRKHDITTRYELEKARHRMELLALKDPLTGAWNRRFLEQRFQEIVSGYREAGRYFHFALIDIDDFKQLNDSKGHNYGDLVLRRLVANFLAHSTDNEHLIRVGGDEFALLFSADEPRHLIEGVAAALKSDPELDVARAEGQVKISTGVVTIQSQEQASMDSIYRTADQALYQAKSGTGKQKKESRLVHVAFTV